MESIKKRSQGETWKQCVWLKRENHSHNITITKKSKGCFTAAANPLRLGVRAAVYSAVAHFMTGRISAALLCWLYCDNPEVMLYTLTSSYAKLYVLKNKEKKSTPTKALGNLFWEVRRPTLYCAHCCPAALITGISITIRCACWKALLYPAGLFHSALGNLLGFIAH